jgi:threonyl-tRNA synthetase
MESHLELGNKLNLFFVSDVSPGSIFWKPRGTILFNNLIKLMRNLYDMYGYIEVVTPNIYDKKLWETSGHWDKYRENMFLIEQKDNDTNDIDENKKQFALKAMNCPGHCLVFQSMRPYSKDLPIRMAEFGVLHRNELSGTLHGLTRVRRFQQDDAHIFCRMDQIHNEVLNTLQMIQKVYNIFNIPFTINLSTRPEQFIGNIETWNEAENILENVMKEFNGQEEINKNIGDGAFYGPKIDIVMKDSLGRQIQCGTVQLDFNLPSEERFNLLYTDEHTHIHTRPVIIHRAVLGSIERFIGVILEHTQGKLPLQVTPYPIIITTITNEFNDSALKLKTYIVDELRKYNIKMSVDTDLSNDDIRNKIKSAENLKYHYIVSVGKRESMKIVSDIFSAQIAVRSSGSVTNMLVSTLINNLILSQKI